MNASSTDWLVRGEHSPRSTDVTAGAEHTGRTMTIARAPLQSIKSKLNRPPRSPQPVDNYAWNSPVPAPL
ncbi:MAG: hypothetical protein Kow0040_09280 [Thermogutta sp.]